MGEWLLPVFFLVADCEGAIVGVVLFVVLVCIVDVYDSQILSKVPSWMKTQQ